jgi:hypothetical protein
MLIPRAQQKEHVKKIEQTVIDFLAEEIYSTKENLMMIMGITTRQGFVKAIKRLIEPGYVQEHTIRVLGSMMKVYGITYAGLGVAFADEPYHKSKAFQASRISQWTMAHHLGLQKCRLIFEQQYPGCRWTNGDYLDVSKSEKRPDALLKIDGKKYAIEFERTFKSQKRYQGIMASYLKKHSQIQAEKVLYISENQSMATKLKSCFKGIDYVNIEQKRYRLEPRHYDRFTFVSLDNVANLALS